MKLDEVLRFLSVQRPADFSISWKTSISNRNTCVYCIFSVEKKRQDLMVFVTLVKKVASRSMNIDRNF